jgi:Phage tail tube protein
MSCDIYKIDSNVSGTFIAEEQCLKKLPDVVPDSGEGDAAIWYAQEPNSFSDFGGESTMVARSPIDPSRQNKKGVVVDLDASGGFNQDYTKSNLTRLTQGFMFADARELPSTAGLNDLTPIVITGVTTADDRYAAASGLTIFTVGDIILASGFTNPLNNGVKVVDEVNTAYVGVAGNLADETPPAGAKIEVIGYQFASADLSISVSSGVVSLVTAAGDFTDYDALIPGLWIFIGGDVSTNRFTNNVGFARIKTVNEGSLVFDDVTWTPVNEAGTGKTIQLFAGLVVKNEKEPALIKRRSYNIERTLGEGPTATQAEYLEGAVPNELTFNIPSAEKLNVDLTFVACSHSVRSGESGDERKPGTRYSSPGEEAYNSTSDIYRMKMHVHSTASATTALFGYVSEGSISISNGVTPVKAIGVLGAFDTTAGNFVVGGSLTAFFTTTSAVQAIKSNADVGFSVIGAAKNAGFIWDIPLLSLGGGRLNVEKDQAITVPLEPAGAENANGYTLLHQVFNYLPDVAMPN